MSEYFTLLWSLLKDGLAVFALLILLDVVFGIAVSLLITKDFKWEKLDHYLLTDVLPVFVWVGAVLLSTIPATLVPAGVVPVIVGAVYATVFISIFSCQN
jgi:hypothetical protein